MKTRKPTTVTPQTPPTGASTPRKPTEPTTAAVHQGALDTMAAGIDAIWAAIDDIRTGKATPSQRDPGSVIASLSARAATLYEATRKAEAARLKRIGSIDPATVLQWFRGLDQAGREHILRELAVIETRRNGLA